MKHNNKNIITSDDITVLGKNSGKTLESILESLQENQEKLKSNVKWIYKYGGVGGSGGGSSSTSDKWSVNFTLGGTQVPEVSGEETKTIYFSSPGTKRLYFHINKPGGDSFVVQYRYNDDRNSGRVVLNLDNMWTYETYIDLQTNSEITATIIDGNLTEKNFKVRYVVSAYSLFPSITKNSGEKHESTLENGIERYNLFIRNVNTNGLNFVLKYNSAVNSKVTYYYTKLNSNVEESGEIDFLNGDYLKELINIPIIDNIGNLPNDIAASYYFHFKVIIEGIVTEYNIPIDLLPNDLYLKIVPLDPNTILYSNENIENPKKLLIGNRTFSITPYNGEEGGSNNVVCSYFILNILLENNQGDPINDTIKSGNTFLRTFMFSDPGKNKITFRAKLGNVTKDFVYYFFTENPATSINWFSENKNPSSISYKYGISSNLNINGKELLNGRVISKNANDIQEYDIITSKSSSFVPGTLEVLINIGLLYNYINDETLPIIALPPYSQLDSNTIIIYLNRIEIAQSPLSGNFFIEEEPDYNVDNEKQYHLITLARKFIRTEGVTNYYEISAYIDGVLQANTITHITQSLYNKIQLYRGNYSVNLLDISYFNNGSLNETDIVRYWYAYQTQIRGEIENINKLSYLLSIFNEFVLEKSNNLFNGHVKVSESTLSDLVLNINVPVMCLEYNPLSNLKNGVPMDFFEDWSDVLYTADSNDALSLTVGLRWANGSGNSSTQLLPIDTSSITTPDGTLKNGQFRLDIQGSTTRSYKGKNYLLTLEFTEEDNAYIPIYTPWFNMDDKNSYLPENSFTLKADIVDSSHTNNTCMGKFINAISLKFEGAKQRQSIYSDHIKNCLEGFPFLLFVRINKSNDNYFLGIYNFNLGRTSNFNLGYCDLRALPSDLARKSSENFDFSIYSVARTSTLDYIGAEIMEGLITAEIDGNESWFDFSQYDKSILFLLPDWPNDEQYMFSEIVSGQDTSGLLSENTKNAISDFVKRSSRSGGYIFEKLGKGFHDNINYNYTTAKGFVPNAKILYERYKDAEGLHFSVKESNIIFEDSDLYNYLFPHGDQNEIAPFVDYLSIVEYYTICMAFGLLDSVSKNLNIKTWNKGNTFYLSFYDMDTCLGINNDGKSVLYYAYSDYWENPEGLVINTINNIPVISAGNITVSRDYSPPSGGDINFYDIPSNYVFAVAKYARSVIEKLRLLTDSQISIDSVLTPLNLWASWRSTNGELRNSNYFVQKYYEGYMNGINELMFNYNFRAKYFREGADSTLKTFDEEAKRFRGRSIGYVKDWLSKRFHMLDAYLNLAKDKEIVIADGANYNLIPISLVICEAYPTNSVNYSSDVSINLSIFGLNPSFSGDIDLTVQAPDYTPIVVIGGSRVYRYLLEDSSKMYNIRINNTGTNKLIFGGSSMWTYLDSINSIANGTVSITSDKLTILRGDLGNTNGWALNMPSLLEVHLNGLKYGGLLSFGRDSNFANLTTIDISNSSIQLEVNDKAVRTINLSNVKSPSVLILNCNYLENLIFSNSSIELCSILPLNYISNGTTYTLNANHIKTLNLTTEKTNIRLKISNDDTLTNLNIEGFVNVTIDNCKSLQNIESAGNKLNSLTITNCPELLGIKANVENCNSITADINSNKLESLVFYINGKNQSLTTLKLPQSKINKIEYRDSSNNLIYVSPDKTFNLKPFIRLNDFDIRGNNLIEYIIFNNDISYPIYIRNSFEGCSKLKRIYGCINIVNTNNVFNGLSNFSIHGELSDSWKGYSKTKDREINGINYSIVLTPLLLLTNEEFSDTHPTIIEKYNTLTKADLFLEGENVTNIYFGDSNKNISGSFYLFTYNTNISQFDVYYLLNSFGLSLVNNNITLGNGALCSKNPMFKYSEGNQLNRYTFYKCNRITYLGASTSVFNINENALWYSPEISKGYDNGLFSPLTGLTGISSFTSSAYISKNVFRRVNSNEKYPLTYIGWQGIARILDNIDSYKVLSEFLNNSPNISDSSVGNMQGFFDQTNISSLAVTFNMDVIDYNTLSFPITITSINGCFRNSYGKGEFKWKETLFNKGLYSGLTSVAYSFVLGEGVSQRVPFVISEDMFEKTPNLIHLGYLDYSGSSSSSGFVNNNPQNVSNSFLYGLCGNGFIKTLKNDEFPVGITSNLRNIENLVGLFAELYNGAESIPNITIDFPGNLFITRNPNGTINKTITPNLRNISALFADCRININLTSKGFEGLPLTSVNRLFYNSVYTNDLNIKRSLDGVSIPYNFFYLGTNNTVSKDYYGTNDLSVVEADLAFMEDNETGEEFLLNDSNKTTVPLKNYNRRILYATECFFGQDKLLPYEWNKDSSFNITEFPNNNYIPYKYYKENGVWKTREDSSLYTKLYDISSIYDGDSSKLENEAYCRDSDFVEDPGLSNLSYVRNFTNKYFCPPDLFYSFISSSDLNINGMFRWCGVGSADPYGPRERRSTSFNTSGRICPYLFDSIDGVVYLYEFFENFKGINSYKIGNITYLIPPTLFEKANKVLGLAKTFSGMYFDGTPNYTFLTYLNKPLDIRGIFSMCLYSSNFAISGVFSNNQLSRVSGAFCARVVTLLDYDSNGGVSVSETRDNVRLEGTSCTFGANISSCRNALTLSKNSIYFVYWYTSSDRVDSNEKTFIGTGKHNYGTVGNE